MVERGVVGEGLVGNIGDQLTVMTNAEARLGLDGADDHSIQTPLFKDAEDLVFAAFGSDQQHSLLALGEHDFIGAHAGFALGDEVQFNVKAHAAAATHLAGGTS